MAGALLEHDLSRQNIKGISVSSCGTGASPEFKVPVIVSDLMAAEGIDLAGHEPKQVTRKLVSDADLILVMETHHLEHFSEHFPEAMGKVFLLKEYLGEEGSPEILDPIGQPDEMYIESARNLGSYIKKLATILHTRQRHLSSRRKK